MMQDDQMEAIRWARELVGRTDWVILDTETTGLYGADIVQLAVLSAYGHALLDVLIQPTQPITPGAARVHGLRMEHLAGALTFPQVYPLLAQVLTGRQVLIYNAAFDTAILTGMCERLSLPLLPFMAECVMLRYAAYMGEWSDYHGGYRWHHLPGGDHQAVGDCRAVLTLLHTMAASRLPDDPPPAVDPPAAIDDFPF